MSGFDEIIHQPVRLRIASALATLGPEDKVDFTHVKRLLGLSDGNLGAHLLKLEEAGYLIQEKTFVDRKPRTWLMLTPAGRAAFRGHVAALRDLLGQD
jgi:DNA-binding MarR family transcriptional regulator